MDKINRILSDLQNPRKHAQAGSVDGYFTLPKNERTKWGFWYLLPQFLPWTTFEEKENDGGWGQFYAQIKKEYPVQYFLREVIWRNIDINWYCFKSSFEGWWIYLFNPQHNELRAAIPRNWYDLDGCITNFLYACIVSFSEKEDGLKNYHRLIEDKKKHDKLKSRKISKEDRAKIKSDLADQWGEVKYFIDYYNANFENYQKLNEIYNYAKFERPKYLKTLNEGEDFIDVDGSKVEWGVIEELSNKYDDLYLVEIVRQRNSLWT